MLLPSSCRPGRAGRLGVGRRRGVGTRKRRWEKSGGAAHAQSPRRVENRLDSPSVAQCLDGTAVCRGDCGSPLVVETNGTHHRVQVRRSMRVTRVVKPTSGKSSGTACRLATFAGSASCRLHIRLRTPPANGRARRPCVAPDRSCNRSMAPLGASRRCCKYPAGSVRRQKSSWCRPFPGTAGPRHARLPATCHGAHNSTGRRRHRPPRELV